MLESRALPHKLSAQEHPFPDESCLELTSQFLAMWNYLEWHCVAHQETHHEKNLGDLLLRWKSQILVT